MPQDLVEIQVEQPQKENDYQEYTELENLDAFRFDADIYVQPGHAFNDIQSKGYSGLVTFYGTDLLVSLAGKVHQAIMISSKK